MVLKSYDDPLLAHLDTAKLADEGIESFVQDVNAVSTSPYLANALGGVKLLVFDHDFDKARKVLAVNESDSLSIVFEERLDPQRSCPGCGSTNIIQRNSLLSGMLSFILICIPLSFPTNKWFCAKCGIKWKIP